MTDLLQQRSAGRMASALAATALLSTLAIPPLISRALWP